MLDIRQLTSFLAVARLGSFTKAASALNYSQSTVSDQVLALEHSLGVRLFERLGRQIFLTPGGKKLLPYAEQVTDLCNEIPLLFTAGGALRGELVIAAAETLCVFRLPSFLREFRRRYPHIRISLKVGGCVEFPGWLRSNQVDAAFTMNNESRQADLVSRPFSSEQTVIVCGPSHPLASKAAITLADLHQQALILTEEGCDYRLQFESLLAAHEVCPQSVVAFGSIAAIKQCVHDDPGLSFLPRIAAAKELADGDLVELPCPALDIIAESRIIYHKSKWLAPALETFLTAALASEPEQP